MRPCCSESKIPLATNYFFAIAIVMTDWLWLIAWIAMEMV
jgi:hypothetical protein